MELNSLQYLQSTLAQLDQTVRAAVERAKQAGDHPTDALRGLVISDDEVETLLSYHPMDGPFAKATTLPSPTVIDDSPFVELAQTFNLTPLDSDILLICVAAELDRRYERLFAFLQDDVSQRRPTVNLVMNLLGDDAESRYVVWERLAAPERPLREHHLISCLPDPQQREPVFLAYQLKADTRIVGHLLGRTAADVRLEGTLTFEPTVSDMAELFELPVIADDAPMIYLQGADGAGQQEIATTICAQLSKRLARVDLRRLKGLQIPFELAWQLALREARLAQAGILLEGWEGALDENREAEPDLWRALLAYEGPVFMSGLEAWEPSDNQRTRRLIRHQLKALPYTAQLRCWEMQTADMNITGDALEELASKFRLTAGQIARAVQSAEDYAASRDVTVTLRDLYAGAQAQSSLKLGKLAQRIQPRHDWDDLILPDDRIIQLQEVCARARFAHIVQEAWGFGRKIAPTNGVKALFAGESGTGKTMAASIIARELGLVLYRVDLSSVVSKYIGETEKNLREIFEAADANNAVLLFDEADALFGKRSEVKDAHDRYANIEVAYLLQQIEQYNGIAIMATNLRQNLDEAFTRRLDFLIDFPFPDTPYRRQIWATHLPAEAPIAAEVNLEELANRYPLAGGNIRNAVLASAYLAAADGGTITMAHLRQAIRREHQKMGRLLEDDFHYSTRR